MSRFAGPVDPSELAVPGTTDGLVVRYGAFDLAKFQVDDVGTGEFKHFAFIAPVNATVLGTPSAANSFADWHTSTGAPTMNGIRNPIKMIGANLDADGQLRDPAKWGVAWTIEQNWFDGANYNIEAYLSVKDPNGGSAVETRPFMYLVEKSGAKKVIAMHRANKHRFYGGSYGSMTQEAFEVNVEDRVVRAFPDMSAGNRSFELFSDSSSAVFLRIRANGAGKQVFLEAFDPQLQEKVDNNGNVTITRRHYIQNTPVVVYGPVDRNSTESHVFQGFSDSHVTMALVARASQTANLLEFHNTAGTVRTTVNANGLPVLPSFTVSGVGPLPSASANTGAVVFASDGQGTKGSTVTSGGTGTLVRSNGTNWIVL